MIDRHDLFERKDAADTVCDVLHVSSSDCQVWVIERGQAEQRELYDSVKKSYDEQTNPRYGAARLWVDKIIDPMDTREALITALEAAAVNPEMPPFKVGVLQT